MRIMKARQAKGMTQKELATVSHSVRPAHRIAFAGVNGAHHPRLSAENVGEAAGCQPVREWRGGTQQPGARQDGKNPWRKAEGCTWSGWWQEEEEEVNGVWWPVGRRNRAT